ncbi:head-tail adaptor protein [Clostridium malenominatum]|uniref:Head-tail adaptor protein n=1 Tax=Clostridium malenominatum TaxID=1539 RepID=A0ABN1J1T9_9CLOT
MSEIKKFFVIFFSFIIIITSFGCRRIDRKPTVEKEVDKTFDIKAAKNIVDGYMSYLTNDDYENALKFYSKELLTGTSKTSKDMKGPLKIKGYNIDEIIELGRAGLFKVKVTKMSEKEPYASLEEYTIKINKEDMDYKIQDINTITEREIFLRHGTIRIRVKNNIDNNLLIENSGIPSYEYSKNDKAKTNKLEVPKNNYGPMIFSYKGESLVITTYDKDSYIGLIKVDESMTVQGEASSGGQGGEAGQGGQQGAQGGQQQKGNMAKEKPMGKNITSLDLIQDSKVNFVVFSSNEKFVLAQYTKDNAKSIRVYEVETGEIISYEFEKYYPMNKVNVIFSSFDKDSLNFEVVPRVTSDKSIGGLVGRWQLDLKEFKVKKV